MNVSPKACKPLVSTSDVRWMIRRDMLDVLKIESASYEHPWCEEDFLRCLSQRNCIGMVVDVLANEHPVVIAFMIYELRPHSLKVINAAVHPAWRRQGIGRVLIKKLASKLSSHRRTKVVFDVRETNLPAQLFLRATGCIATKILRGFYGDSGESAIRFAYRHDVTEPESVNRLEQYIDD